MVNCRSVPLPYRHRRHPPGRIQSMRTLEMGLSMFLQEEQANNHLLMPAGRYGPNTEAVARLARTLRQLA